MHAKVREILSLERDDGARIKYYPNTGNAGDSLINVGFYQMAEEIGLRYEIISQKERDDIRPNEVVIIGGGGALVPEWDATPLFIEGIIGRCKKIIVLPQSIRGVDGLLKKLNKEDIVFCRERYSYQGCISLGLSCELYLSDDMAFNVDVGKLLVSKKSTPELTVKNISRYMIYCYHLLVRSKTSRRIDAFRCDKESNNAIKVKRTIINDFSAVARFGSGPVAKSNYSAHMFLKLIDMYDEVSSDRLHVIVAASLLQKKINAYPNSYYKVKGVIEHSLGGYPNITLNEV